MKNKDVAKIFLCCSCDYSTAALIRNAKNRLYVHHFTLFSLEIFDMRIEKAAVFFDKIFNLVFLQCFSVIRWNFGIFWFFSMGEYYC